MGEKLIVVVDSLTGQTERFASKMGLEMVHVFDYEPSDKKVILATRSYDFGQITEEAKEFLNEYADHVVGTVVSGNRNWGTNYGAAGRKIQEEYGIPCILIFEGSGFRSDHEYIIEWIKNYK